MTVTLFICCVVYGIGALVWLIRSIAYTVREYSILKRKIRFEESERLYYERHPTPANKHDWDYAVEKTEEARKNATFNARMVLATPIWPLFAAYAAAGLILGPFFLLVFPNLDKKAKQRRKQKEEADAQARLYPA